jgi:hypothetical protein
MKIFLRVMIDGRKRPERPERNMERRLPPGKPVCGDHAVIRSVRENAAWTLAGGDDPVGSDYG